MLYLLLCSLVLFIGIAKMHGHLFKMLEVSHGDVGPRRANWLAGLTGIIPALAFTMPVYMVFFGVAFGSNDSNWSFDTNRLIVYALLAGSLALLTQSLYGVQQARQSSNFGFWNMGRIVVLALAGIVGTTSAYKHLTFFTSDQDGFANVGLLREIADLSDMKNCKGSIALVQYRATGPISYRCPSLLMFGRDTSQPFIPWPDYVEGTSQGLADAIATINDASEHGYTVKRLEK